MLLESARCAKRDSGAVIKKYLTSFLSLATFLKLNQREFLLLPLGENSGHFDHYTVLQAL